MKTITRLLTYLGLGLLSLALLLGGFGVYTVRRAFPQTSGEIQLAGLQGAVDVYRDSYGIPHVYADSQHDLFMAQGYLHAQDRFYQMDFWRHITAGRLSELYGASQLETDQFLRTLGWARLAEQEYALLDADTRSILEAYADGVNAYLSSRSAADISLEYSVLALNGLSNYQPEPWTPVHTLAWAKSMAWDLGGNMTDEIKRAMLMQLIGPDKTNDFMPLYPADHPVILPDPAVGALNFAPAGERAAAVSALLSPLREGLGSNDWVIAGSRTTTGQPLLADDPHLSIQMPSIWYEIGLYCRTVNATCPYAVTGFSFASAPGVIVGHNQRIAWGVTNVGPDVQDLFIEKLNPANPNQYEVNGQWLDMSVQQETIKVKGGADVPLTIRTTRHGPLISEIYARATALITQSVKISDTQLDTNYALAFRWAALEPIYPFRAVLRLNRAKNWEEFRDALRDFSAPSQNFVYADVDGNIGYQVPGNIPIRKQGDGLLPVPGWTDEYEWTGYIPYEELPYSYNPPQGYIATANNAVVDSTYPHLLTLEWDSGYRAERIVELIEAQPKISAEYIQQIQGDDMNLGAKELLPYVLTLVFHDLKLEQARQQLASWDFQMRIDSQPAALYAAFFKSLLDATFHDDLPEQYWPSGGGSNWLTLRNIAADPNNTWWDNTTTSATETRDEIIRQAFREGYALLEARLGSNSNLWTWGALHGSVFANQTLGRSGVKPIEMLFNRGPVATSGGGSIVNATSWNATRADPFAVTNVPSMRMIVDLGNFANSLTMHTTGQSGHAYHPHYDDMIDPWRLIQYHPMLWEKSAVESAAQEHLVLKP